MSEFYMLCGIPGSGKSYYAERLKREKNCIVHSSDAIREELGDVNDQSKNTEVFEILHKRIKDDLRNGNSVVYDATNLNRKRRVAFLKELKNISCKKVCILIATPWEICVQRNKIRDRHVPDEVMDRMYKNFQIPCTREGFDEVIIFYEKEEWKTFYGNVIVHLEQMLDFDQDNSHHTLTLGEHMIVAGDNLLHFNGRVYDDVFLAALTHDIGKVLTKTFYNKKGELTEDAHYYQHNNVGAYDSLFFEYPHYIKDKEYVALLIESHMKPYMEWKQSEKAKQRDLELFGQQFIEDVEMLHEADVQAH